MPTFSGGANVFPTTPQGSTGSAGADVSCPLFPPPSGTKTLGTGREGPMEHLGMDVRGGLSGRLPVWCLFSENSVLELTSNGCWKRDIKDSSPCNHPTHFFPPTGQQSPVVATLAILDRYPETKAQPEADLPLSFKS